MHPFFASSATPLKPCDRHPNPYHGREVLRFAEVTAADFDRYCAALESAGFSPYIKRTLAQNRFATYTTPLFQAHLAFYPALGEMRVTHGSRSFLPPTEPCTARPIQTPTLTQIKLSDIGQSDIIQLADGSFLLIDGGVDNEVDRAYLLDFLYEKKPAHHEKPRIAAWLISHAHNDHIHLCQEFLLSYSDRVEVELFGYDFPDFSDDMVTFTKVGQQGRTIRWQNRMRDITRELFPLSKQWEMHSGETLHLPGCDVDVMFGWEDYWPQEMLGVNATACSLRLRFEGGKTAFFATDAWFALCDQMALMYGDELKSDVLQASHHGSVGTIPFHERIDPEVVLWAYPLDIVQTEKTDATTVERLYERFGKHPYCTWLLEHAKRHYHHSETVTLDMKTLEIVP